MVIDECWLSRQKRSQRDQGRVTKPQEILAPSGTESQWRPPLLRAERRAETIERVARSLCRRGCEMWSDEWSGHDWLDAPDCTYNAVNHMKKSRCGGKAPTPARTTSAGLGDIFANVVYARAKKWLIVGLVLREFTWTPAVLNRRWQSASCCKLLVTLQQVQDKEALLERATYRDDTGNAQFSRHWPSDSWQRLVPRRNAARCRRGL